MSLVAVKDSRKHEGDGSAHRNENTKPVEVVKAHTKTRRKPVQRTREEERAAYGRVFHGCGHQSDYEVINKLGEGTFGCVDGLVTIIFMPSSSSRTCADG